MDPVEWDQLNVINAAKAWYRGIMQGVHWRDEVARRAIINGLPPALKRMALMVMHMLETERKRPPTPPPKSKKTKARDHLRVVK